MKGRILKILQSTHSNIFLVIIHFLALHVSAGELTNVPGRIGTAVPFIPDADKGLLEFKPSFSNNIPAPPFIMGSTNITSLEEMLRLYADTRGRTVLWPEYLTFSNLSFTSDKPLTQEETE